MQELLMKTNQSYRTTQHPAAQPSWSATGGSSAIMKPECKRLSLMHSGAEFGVFDVVLMDYS